MEDDFRRMQWASRRGMLELDLVLEPFVQDHYRALGDQDRMRYHQLMGCEDQDLYAWLVRGVTPPDPELGVIVTRIRDGRAS